MSGRILTERLLATTSLAALILAGTSYSAYAAPCSPGGSNSDTISSIIINAGCTTSLTNTAAGVIGPPIGIPSAIAIGSSATVTGAIVNAGRIIGPSSGATAIGIGVAGLVGGGISNSGSISINATNAGSINAYGINVGFGLLSEPSSFGGGISNSGTIAVSVNGTDALIYGIVAEAASFDGSVLNSGTIAVTAVASTNSASAFGVSLNDAGGPVGVLGNSGTISATASAAGSGSASAVGFGTFLDAATGFANSGSIAVNATNTGTGQATAQGANLRVYNLASGFSNSGSITATASAIAANVMATGASVGFGFGTSLGGGVFNSGTISASGSSAGSRACAKALSVNATLLTGGITNSGMLSASATVGGTNCAKAFATGINVSVTTMTGALVNSGRISVTASATGQSGCCSHALATGLLINGFATSATIGVSNAGGGITNSGAISVSAAVTNAACEASAGAHAIEVLNPGTINGGFLNSGTLSAVAMVSVKAGCTDAHVSATGIRLTASILSGGIANSGTITATAIATNGSCNNVVARGISADIRILSGGVTNSGTISVTATNSGAGSVSNFVEALGIGVTTETSFAGNVVNSGQIIATAVNAGGGSACAHGLAAWFEGVSSGAAISNSGAIIARASSSGNSAVAVGMAVTNFAGVIANSGTIAGLITGGSGYGAGIAVTDGGGIIINNSGVVQGTNWGIDISKESTNSTINLSAGSVTGGSGSTGGALKLSANADVVNISGGAVSGNIVGGGAANIVNVAMGNGNTFAYANQITNIGTLNLSNGTLLLQNLSAPGVSTVNYNQSAGSTLALEVSPAASNNHASLSASGAISLASGSVFQAFEGAFAWTPGTYTYAGVVTGAPITGSFTPTSNSPFFTATLSQSSTVDNLTVTMLSPSQVPGLNNDQQSVASAIIGINGGNTTLDQLFTLSNPGPALTQLSGSQFTQMNYLPLIEAWQTFTDSLTDRLSQGGGYGGAVSASYDSGHGLQFAQADIPQQVAQASDGTPLRTAPMGQRWGVWARGYGLTSSAPSTATNAPYSESGSGVMIGADNQITDRIVAGVAVNIATDKATVTGGGFTQVNAYQGSAYGQYSVDPNWYVNGVAGFGWQNYSTARVVSFGTTMVNNGNFDGQSYRAYGETGYALHPAFVPQTRVTPYLGLGFLHTHTDSFTETGSSTALNVQSMDPNSFTTTIGARIAATWQIGSTVFRPELRAAWQHEFLDETATMRASFAIAPGSSAFTATGTSFGSDSFLGGAGLTTTITSSTQVFFDYDAKVTGGYTAQSVSGGLRVQF